MTVGALLFSGTDLSSLCVVEDLDDFFSASDLRGDLAEYPGISGATGILRPTSSKLASGQATVSEDTHAAADTAVSAVKALFKVGQSQTLTRRKVTASGNLDVTQTVIFRQPAERWLGDGRACTILFNAELLDGLWYSSAVTISSAAGTQSVAGEAPTRKMTLTLDAGAARTVANSTNGFSFTFGTTVPSGGVTVDVVNRTATAVTGGADLSAYLSWAKVAPFQLEAGSNVLTVSSGAASISYQPAYL